MNLKGYLWVISILAAVGLMIALVIAALTSALVRAALEIGLTLLVAGALTALLAGAAYGLIWLKNQIDRQHIATATLAAQSVQFHSVGQDTYTVNPLGLSIQAMHLDSRTFIEPGEDEPDELSRARLLAHFSRTGRGVARAAPMLALPAPVAPPLLPAIIHLQRILIVGGQGSGKTNLARHLAAEKRQLSKVLVIDTHARPGLWPPGCHVIGARRNYQAVEAALQALVKLMGTRFDEIGQGLADYRQHELITLCSDEWTMLPAILGQEKIKQYTVPLLTESRKAGIDLVLCAHDDKVRALGIERMSGLKEAFDAVVRMRRDAATGTYTAMVEFDKNDVRAYTPPGAFVGPLIIPSGGTGPYSVADPVEPDWIAELKAGPPPIELEPARPEPPKPTDAEMKVIEIYVDLRDNQPDKFSYNEVCRRLGWTVGGKQARRIKDILGKFGIEAI